MMNGPVLIHHSSFIIPKVMPQPPEKPAAAFRPYVAAEVQMAESTPRAVALGAVLGVIFGAVSVYLALKAGLTVSASIPVAVLSVSIFKWLGKSTILENNMVRSEERRVGKECRWVWVWFFFKLRGIYMYTWLIWL